MPKINDFTPLLFYTLENPKVHTGAISKVTPNLKTLRKFNPYIKTMSLIAKRVVPQYQKLARIPTFIRCETPIIYPITLSNSGNIFVLPI